MINRAFTRTRLLVAIGALGAGSLLSAGVLAAQPDSTQHTEQDSEFADVHIVCINGFIVVNGRVTGNRCVSTPSTLAVSVSL